MESRVLPYEIDVRGYFPADMLSLSILKANDNQISLLYGFHNIFSFEYFSQDGKIFYNVELDWECPTLCRKEIPRYVLHKNTNFSLLDFIVSSIDEDYYVYLTVDSSKISCYTNFNTVFAPHPMLIYGYDKTKKIVYIADFLNGVKYKKNIVSYEELLQANSSLIYEMKVLDPYKGTNESILDIELIKYLKNSDLLIDIEYLKNSVKNFLGGINIMGNSKCILENRCIPRTFINSTGKNIYYEAKTADERYGVNVFAGIIEFYENCMSSDKYVYNFRHTFIINSYYELIIAKIEILKQRFNNNIFNEKVEMILKDKERHQERMRMAVLLSIKYSIKLEKKDLRKVINILKMEIQYITNISVNLLEVLEQLSLSIY